jgi:hypothetical protein
MCLCYTGPMFAQSDGLFGRAWRGTLLVLLSLAPRLYLLRVFDVELSNDGFDAVNTLSILRTQGAAAVPRELADRFILHPLYMLLLGALRVVTPDSVDFYLVARLFSALLACLAVCLMFHFVRSAFSEGVAWVAALLLAFAPSFLWESASILSSTLFLSLYIAVLVALVGNRYRLAAFLAFLSAITRYEGAVLVGLVLLLLLIRDLGRRRLQISDWFTCLACALSVPLTVMGAGWLAAGNPLEFLGAQSMAAIWLRFMAPGDFPSRALFFVTRYDSLFPAAVVWLGAAGLLFALLRHRCRATAILLITSGLYVVFFWILAWLNYTTLETRFLMYPGFSLLVFAALIMNDARQLLERLVSGWMASGVPADAATRRPAARGASMLVVAVVGSILLLQGYQQGVAGMTFVYNMHAAQRQVAEELGRLLPQNEPTKVVIYGGISGALDMYARQQGLLLSFTYFRFVPEDRPERYLIEQQIRWLVYPLGNAFAQAKYPYLEQFQPQTHDAVAFGPVTQFTTRTDGQLWYIWSAAAQ